MIKTNRRGFLATTGAGLMLPALFPHPLGAQSAVSYAPFTQQQFQGLISVAAESYVQAYIRDPSNPSFVGPFPSLDGGDGGFTWAFTTIDSAFQAAGLYNQTYDLSGIPAFERVNPNLHTFIANSAQVGIKADFFKSMSNIDFALAAGATGITGYSIGLDLQDGIQSVISVTTQYQLRKYAKLHRRNVHPQVVPAVYHGEPFYLTKAFFDPTATTAVISGASVAMVGTGLKMIEMGGGVTALSAFFSGAEVASAAAGIFLSGGTILVILGFAAAAYVAYRIVTQVKGESGPWMHPDSNPGDPPYLQRIYAKPSIFPPQMGLQPYVTSTIHY